MQISLFNDQSKRKSIIHVSPDKCAVSWLNPRRTRPKEYVAKLAERMNRNGFEITRALWAYAENGHYEVFAGGTRLEAAKVAQIEALPIVLHEGYNEDELTRLADEDNENDEYHTPVSVVDVWMDYKRLADAGWTQQRIATAKGLKDRTIVSDRIKYASLPESVMRMFVENDFLKEGHAAQISSIVEFPHLGAWRNFESVAMQVVSTVLYRTGAKSPTAQQFKQEVEKQNDITKLAHDLHESLDGKWKSLFVSELTNTKADSRPSVQAAFNAIRRQQLAEAKQKEDEAAKQASKAEQERLQLEREANLAAAKERVLAKFVQGDSRSAIQQAPGNIRLLLTDPPYGKNFQSNRRVASAQAPKLVNDDKNAFDLLADVLQAIYPKMADDSFAIVWTDWKYYSAFEKIVLSVGLDIRTVIVWDKPNHGTGDLEGTPAPKHEWAIFAVKGNPKLNFRFDNVMTGSKFIGTEHPTEKPVDLLETIIKAATAEGDLVVDPFAGSGSTPITAFKLHRDFWACELDEAWHSQSKEKLFDAVEAQFNG